MGAFSSRRRRCGAFWRWRWLRATIYNDLTIVSNSLSHLINAYINDDYLYAELPLDDAALLLFRPEATFLEML